MVIANAWSRIAIWLAYGLLVVSLATLSISLAWPESRWLDSFAVPLFISSGAVLIVSLLLQPRMGKAELRRRYGGFPRFLGEYFRQCSPWILAAQMAVLAIGVVFVVLSMTSATAHSSVTVVDGRYYLRHDGKLAPTGVAEFHHLAMVTRVWGTVGAAIVIQAVTITFQRADLVISRALKANPGLAPMPFG